MLKEKLFPIVLFLSRGSKNKKVSHSRHLSRKRDECRHPISSLFTALLPFVLAASTSVFADANWPNEPSGSSVAVDCPFSGNVCNLVDVYNSSTFANFSNSPLSPTGALDSFMAVNSQTGSGQWFYPLPNVREIYVGTWWSTNSDFMGYSNNQGKMLFVRNPAIDNNFLVWQGAPGAPKTLKWYMQASYDNCGHAGEQGMCYTKGDGTGWFEPNAGASGTVAAGSGWHRIEFYLKASSSKTSRDGVVRWWLDGQLVGNYPNVNMTPDGFTEFQINQAWDGSGSCSTRDCSKSWHHYFDHLRVSVPNGGNINIPQPQPQPQPQPMPQPLPQPSVGTVNDLAVVSTTSSTVSVSFTEVSDGTGAPAKYDLRYGPVGSYWGAMSSVSAGSCAVPIAGAQVGAKKNCTISGLAASTPYQLQIVAFSGTMNQGAIYGGLSSSVNATTTAGGGTPQPQPQPGAPTVSFIYPSNGAAVTDSILVLAQAVGGSSISEVRFYLDGLQLGAEIKQAPYMLLVDTHQFANGSHLLTAIAKDTAGVQSAIAKVEISVVNTSNLPATDPLTAAAGCVMGQTKTNQVNASMGLIWLLPIMGLARRRKRRLSRSPFPLGFGNRYERG